MVGSDAYPMLPALHAAGVVPEADGWAARNVLIYAVTARADMAAYADLFLSLPDDASRRQLMAFARAHHCHQQVGWVHF